jgi:hypothetical protein
MDYCRLSNITKLKKEKHPLDMASCLSLFSNFLILKIFWGKNSRIYTTKEHFPENSQENFSPKKDKICQCEGTNYWTISTHTPLLGFSWCLPHLTESVNYSRITTHALGKADCTTPCETRM